MKIAIVAAVGILAGFAAAPFAHKTVSAAPEPLAQNRFQITAAIVDEPDSGGMNQPIHEAFLVDSSSGRVWRYQSVLIVKGVNGQPSEAIPEKFVAIREEAP